MVLSSAAVAALSASAESPADDGALVWATGLVVPLVSRGRLLAALVLEGTVTSPTGIWTNW